MGNWDGFSVRRLGASNLLPFLWHMIHFRQYGIQPPTVTSARDNDIAAVYVGTGGGTGVWTFRVIFSTREVFWRFCFSCVFSK